MGFKNKIEQLAKRTEQRVKKKNKDKLANKVKYRLKRC